MIQMKINVWCVILNPISGRGKSVKHLPEIESLLRKYNIPYKIFISKYPGHSIHITQKALLSGIKKFIAIGGDGSLNEIVNGIFSQKKIPSKQCTLAAIPVGTGNDWARNNRLGKSYEEAIQAIAENSRYLHDIGSATFQENNKKTRRYFINFAGIGFDSAVVANMTSRKFGSLSYLAAILKTFLFYKGTPMQITVNGKSFQKDAFVLMTALGKYCGGGMFLAPRSIPNDGVFDVTLVKSLSRIHLLFSIPQIYNGSILNHSRVERFQCRSIQVESSSNIRIEADGELLGSPPVLYEIMKQSLKVIGRYSP